MHSLITKKLYSCCLTRIVKRSAIIGFILFDILFVVIVLWLVKFVEDNKTLRVIFENTLKELEAHDTDDGKGTQDNQLRGSMSILERFYIFTLYRLSLVLTTLHSLILFFILLRKLLFGKTEHLQFHGVAITMVAIVFLVLSFFLSQTGLVIYSKFALGGSFLIVFYLNFEYFRITFLFLQSKSQVKKCSLSSFICVMVSSAFWWEL